MSKKTTQKLVLLDAHAIIHRAYHALPDFSTSSGVPTGALYGFSTMLMKIIADLKPDYIVACYDLPGKTFRHEAYDEYKSGRKKTDDALKEQLQLSRELCKDFSIPIYDKAGFEADDIIGTIVEQTKKDKNLHTTIATGDMDALQLVDGKDVVVYTLKKGINDTIVYDEKGVIDRFEFGPELLPDYKGLRGDPSDNIKGIAGIGDKTATELIKNFGTIENIYKVLKKDEKKLLDAGIKPRIVNLLKEGEEDAMFSKTLAIIRRDVPIKFSTPKSNWKEDVDIDDIEKMFAKYEFRTLSKRLRKLLGLEQLEVESTDKLSDDEINKTAIQMWLLDSEKTNGNHEDILNFANTDNFEDAQKYISEQLAKDKKTLLVYKEIEEPIIEPIKKIEEKGILVDIGFFKKLSESTHKELNSLETEIHKLAGEGFNIKSPKQLSEVLFDKLQLPTKGIKRSATGVYSTNIEMLEKLKEVHPIIEKIIKYREAQKLTSTYIDVIPNMVDKDKRLHAKFIQHGTTTGRFSSNNPNMQNIPVRTKAGRDIRNGFIASKNHILASFDYSQIELRVLAMLSGDKKLTKIFVDGKDVHSSVASYIFKVKEDEVNAEMRRVAKIVNFGIIYGMGVRALAKNIERDTKEAEKFYNEFFDSFSGVGEYLDDVKEFAKKNGYTETLFGRKRQFANIQSKVPFIRAMAQRMAINAPIQGTAADILKLAIKNSIEKIKEAKLNDKIFLLLQIHDELVFEIHKDVHEQARKIIMQEMENVMINSFLKYKTNIPLIVHESFGQRWGELK